MVDKDSKEKDHSRKYSDDDEEEDDNDDEHEEQKDYSLTLRNKRSATIPKVNLLGADIKLDFLTLAGLAIGSLGALGAGYLIFDQFNKSKVIEEEKRKYLEQERLRQQAITDQYLRAEQIRLQRQQQHNLIESQKRPPAYQLNNEGLINMDELGYDEANTDDSKVPQMSYEQMLNRNNNFEPNYRDMANNSTQRQQPQEEDYPQAINMDQLNPVQPDNTYNNHPPPVNYRRPSPQQEQDDNNEGNTEGGPTPEELYRTMNENQAYY